MNSLVLALGMITSSLAAQNLTVICDATTPLPKGEGVVTDSIQIVKSSDQKEDSSPKFSINLDHPL